MLLPVSRAFATRSSNNSSSATASVVEGGCLFGADFASLILVSRKLSHVPVPAVNPQRLKAKKGQLLSVLDSRAAACPHVSFTRARSAPVTERSGPLPSDVVFTEKVTFFPERKRRFDLTSTSTCQPLE